ncbi:sodium:proton antiporter [Pontibacillus yanchengensis]|uniref:Sodium:proton antiporter n=2 Tax=Pontibacillus yanchengensis TaxID=462910 RepID=A0ACC7VI54_9BACI|nr:sodium:proton antiporter [Pontibacillus yanchengensis]MYL34586.1 sodium:proton antiporter [Pontibacillus yanchengensis]MYL54452.1 sodium:proton antiporter [Pontibacillus yanchengensis]
MFHSILFDFMLIGALGVGSQWIGWKYRIPAIVVMSIVGLLVGPVFGILQPAEDFGNLFTPIVSIAVAIILFEGSLSLDFREVRGLGRPVLRIVTLGAFIAWLLGSLGAHYVADLSWAVAFVIGGLFIVTGPTVILPLLRQAKLKPRPAAILKWEGIIVDPFGALLSVFAFEIIDFLTAEDVTANALLFFFFASFLAVVIGYVLGKCLGYMFEHGHVPEFLKSPVMFAVVILCFTVADEIAHETGLLAVTAMGMTLANMHISSIEDMRNFKENISVLLVSAIFVMLTASLSVDTLMQIFNLNIIAYVLIMLFLVRPLSIWVSTIGTDLSFAERTLVGWIAPRGIVALTVAGYFASVLLEAGFEDASILTSLTFALVFATVCAHGFSIGWLAKKLDLAIDGQPGVLIVGGSSFSAELAKVLKELKIPVLITDSSWQRLIPVRKSGVPFMKEEILSEQTEYHLDMTPYEYMIAASELDSYNALVCNTFVPEIGRSNLFQLTLHNRRGDDLEAMGNTIGGRLLFNEQATWEHLNDKVDSGYVFRKTNITNQYTYQQYIKELHPETLMLFVYKPSGKLSFFTHKSQPKAETGDVIVSLMPPSKEFQKIQDKIIEQRKESEEDQANHETKE